MQAKFQYRNLKRPVGGLRVDERILKEFDVGM
jgi:hypothetical protein